MYTHTHTHTHTHTQVDGNGVVSMDPDLNSGKPAYRIENRHRGEFTTSIGLLLITCTNFRCNLMTINCELTPFVPPYVI